MLTYLTLSTLTLTYLTPVAPSVHLFIYALRIAPDDTQHCRLSKHGRVPA